MAFLDKDQRGYYHLKERVNGKVRYLRYIGKDPLPYLRDIAKGKETAEILKQYPDLAPRAVQVIIAEGKKRKVGKISLPAKQYRAIIIDPPWPINKILRDERPNQFDLDYPTMELNEISELPINQLAVQDGCHIYLWTTQRFLPDAFKIFEAWGVNYQCLMTWVKNVGFTPFSWMYSTEHCLFGRIGTLPLLKMGMRLDFSAKVREHSRKPEIFYQLVKEASPEPRFDMFGRENRDGFEVWGNETTHFGG